MLHDGVPFMATPMNRRHHCGPGGKWLYGMRGEAMPGEGARLIPPVMQEEIRQLFREAGWSGEVHFDGYVEDYVW